MPAPEVIVATAPEPTAVPLTPLADETVALELPKPQDRLP